MKNVHITLTIQQAYHVNRAINDMIASDIKNNPRVSLTRAQKNIWDGIERAEKRK